MLVKETAARWLFQKGFGHYLNELKYTCLWNFVAWE